MCHCKAFGRSDARGLFREVGYDGPAHLFATHCCLTGARCQAREACEASRTIARPPATELSLPIWGQISSNSPEILGGKLQEQPFVRNLVKFGGFHVCLFVRFGSLGLVPAPVVISRVSSRSSSRGQMLVACESYL